MRVYYTFTLIVLAVWRLTHLLNAEDGPSHLLSRFRAKVRSVFWSELLDCFYCLSLWVAVPFALLLGSSWSEKLLLWPALSGAAILLERATLRESPMYTEDPQEQENQNELLRKNARN
jgi:hypothetical protein